MVLLPYRKVIISSHLSSEEIRRRISEKIEPYKFWRCWSLELSYPISFEGRMFGGTFNIKRIAWRSVFYPIVHGSIKGNSIKITMRLNSFCLAIAMICLGTVMSLAGLCTLVAIKYGHFSKGFFIYWFFTFFGYFLLMVFFYEECKIVESWLKELLS